MNIDLELYKSIKNSGINLLLSVPCIMLKGLLEIIEVKKEIQHIPVTREEEGVGIAAGAYLGGKVSAILMQNSGLGNSINAIKSLLDVYMIPVIFIMSHRGAAGEKIVAQIPMGQITMDLLKCLTLETYILDSPEKIKNIEIAVNEAKKNKKPVAIILKKTLWRESNEKI
ncbi:MAG: sulfopyruvate decarboxylase subunit alpha [Promethearchaeota archaeon]|nr:MAG: sulfopyruvate decarboxylase subunit alpha [Candidatus Lokiarchaeota archaeon]